MTSEWRRDPGGIAGDQQAKVEGKAEHVLHGSDISAIQRLIIPQIPESILFKTNEGGLYHEHQSR
jgi:hypothetical protein